uniref:Ribosome biogenesis protein WDR12 homolog n=1 Tax=Araucaria cunninghamii TaxID=56994 RepID=A0A0D6R405_ARACU
MAEENGYDYAYDESARQVQVRFTTKLPPHLRVPPTSYAVPANVNRLALSKVINDLLRHEKPQPFDFIVEGELIRTSLEELLLIKGISAEKILNLEYILAVRPPNAEEPWLHDDWVSAVDGSYSSFIFTGSYDSMGRIWKPEGLCTHVLEGHKDAITSADFVKLSDSSESFLNLVTASKDQTLRLWQFNPNKEVANVKTVRTCRVLKGHTSSVQTVSASPRHNLICSGSWDCSIKIWEISGELETESSVSLKKRKLEYASLPKKQLDSQAGASRTLEGHTECVSAVVWFEKGTIYSASWDHSVRSWDVETGINATTQGCGKALNCLSLGGESSALIAAGGADNVLRIWDPRMPGTLRPVLQFSKHKSWITACKWHPTSWHHLISASFDGTLKLWDVRSQMPLITLEAHQDKVLCADWWKVDSVVTGGNDSKLRIFADTNIR